MTAPDDQITEFWFDPLGRATRRAGVLAAVALIVTAVSLWSVASGHSLLALIAGVLAIGVLVPAVVAGTRVIRHRAALPQHAAPIITISSSGVRIDGLGEIIAWKQVAWVQLRSARSDGPASVTIQLAEIAADSPLLAGLGHGEPGRLKVGRPFPALPAYELRQAILAIADDTPVEIALNQGPATP